MTRRTIPCPACGAAATADIRGKELSWICGACGESGCYPVGLDLLEAHIQNHMERKHGGGQFTTADDERHAMRVVSDNNQGFPF